MQYPRRQERGARRSARWQSPVGDCWSSTRRRSWIATTVIDPSSTDLDVHWRTGNWYRKRLVAGSSRSVAECGCRETAPPCSSSSNGPGSTRRRLTRVTGTVRGMNLAEELALVAIDPSSGRHALGLRSELNACLAGLLVAELLLDGVVEIGDKARPSGGDGHRRRRRRPSWPRPRRWSSREDRRSKPSCRTWTRASPTGSASARGMRSCRAWSTPVCWRQHTVASGRATMCCRPSCATPRLRRCRVAADGDNALDPRIAALLSMSGPAYLAGGRRSEPSVASSRA